MMSLYLYDTATGRVLVTADYDERGDGSTGRTLAVGAIDPVTQYAPGGVVTPRPANPTTLDKATMLANGADLVTLANIPAGMVVSVFKDHQLIPRAVVPVPDGILTLTVDSPGTYRLVTQLFPIMDATFQVIAT